MLRLRNCVSFTARFCIHAFRRLNRLVFDLFCFAGLFSAYTLRAEGDERVDISAMKREVLNFSRLLLRQLQISFVNYL